MKEITSKICERLFKVDSIMTISLTAVVCILALRGDYDIKDVFLMVATHYFTKKIYQSNGSGDTK